VVNILLFPLSMPLVPMPRIVLCVALFCALAQTAAALELGESREQLLARHGAPGAEDRARNMAMYFWDGWSAQVEFQQNTIGKLTYRRNWYLGDAEVNSLLQANGGAGRWREVLAANGQSRQWARDDGAIATCLRVRPLSMVFQSASVAAAAVAAAAAEPKVFIPATPSPASTSAPTFPKLLGAEPEPELPVADTPSAPELPVQPLPKLRAAVVQVESPAAPVAEFKSSPPPAPNPPEPKAELAAAPAPAPPAIAEVHPAAAKAPSHALGIALGVLVLVAAMGGGGFYLRRRGVPASDPRTAASRVTVTSTAAEAPGLPQGIGGLRADQFELLIGEIFRRQDYTAELSAAMSADGGIDMTLRRGSETILLQCKHWKMERVTERELREFYGAMAASGAPRGIVVTTGSFAPNAQTFAEGKGIELMDGNALAESLSLVAKPGENLLHVPDWIDEFIAHARIFDPECPVCHGTMVVRHNRANGTPTWCCRGYPRCPGRREPRLDLLAAAAQAHA